MRVLAIDPSLRRHRLRPCSKKTAQNYRSNSRDQKSRCDAALRLSGKNPRKKRRPHPALSTGLCSIEAVIYVQKLAESGSRSEPRRGASLLALAQHGLSIYEYARAA